MVRAGDRSGVTAKFDPAHQPFGTEGDEDDVVACEVAFEHIFEREQGARVQCVADRRDPIRVEEVCLGNLLRHRCEEARVRLVRDDRDAVPRRDVEHLLRDAEHLAGEACDWTGLHPEERLFAEGTVRQKKGFERFVDGERTTRHTFDDEISLLGALEPEETDSDPFGEEVARLDVFRVQVSCMGIRSHDDAHLVRVPTHERARHQARGTLHSLCESAAPRADRHGTDVREPSLLGDSGTERWYERFVREVGGRDESTYVARREASAPECFVHARGGCLDEIFALSEAEEGRDPRARGWIVPSTAVRRREFRGSSPLRPKPGRKA